MSTGLQKHSEPYTGYDTTTAVLKLTKSLLDSLRYHPYVFMLRQHSYGEAIYPYAHQLEALAYLFARRPVRVLIGDEIGLGKTVEAIMVVKYLRELGRAKRVLVLVPRILVDQWIGELKRLGFGVNEVYQVERDTISDLYSKGFPQGVYVASIDLIKREKYRDRIVSVDWDIVIVDEAHRVGKIGNYETQRYSLVAELAARKNRNLVLLSATPHRGKPEDYIERIKLVDPYLIASARELDTEQFYRLINGSLVFRRTKLDVNDVYEKRPVFTKCRFKARTVRASEAEDRFHGKLISFLRSILIKYHSEVGERPSALGLLLVLIAKRASSSPRAAISTLSRIIAKRASLVEARKSGIEIDRKTLEKEVMEEVDRVINAVLGSDGFEELSEVAGEDGKAKEVDEIVNSFAEKCSLLLDEEYKKALHELYNLATQITAEKDSRLRGVINVVQSHLEKNDRVVIFTEFKDTAEYIYEELKRVLPEKWRRKVSLVTSDRIEPPEKIKRTSRESGIEDVKEWLFRGDVDVLVMTDVASEGLNLQHANVVVHYEPPWSPIKIVQRVGRVWRLGQKKDVSSYTILLPVESDAKALEILYAKLLSWYVSGVEKGTVPLGEELELDMLGGSREPADLLVFAPVTDEKGKKIQYSEYRAWLEFIRGGAQGLKEYIEKILAIMKSLKEYAEKVQREEGLKEIKVNQLLKNVLGGLYGREAEEALLELFKSLAKLRGYSIKMEGEKVFAGPYIIDKGDVTSLFRAITSIAEERFDKPSAQCIDREIILIARGDMDIEEIDLYSVELTLNGEPFYTEVVGIARRRDGKEDKLRGPQLLKTFSKIVNNIFAVVHEDSGFEDKQTVMRLESEYTINVANNIVKHFTEYVKRTEGHFASNRIGWMPRDISRHLDKPQVKRISRIIVIHEGVGRATPPPIAIEEVERKAMEIAMEYEIMHGREPRDVSRYEHYDIHSVDPKMGEVRYIEVKGRYGRDVVVELTETEFEYAKKYGNSYWIYIVYNIAEKPQLLIIRNPAKNARWAIVGVKRYVLLGLNSDGAS